MAQEEQRERKNLHAVLTAALDSHLTEPQRRRLWQHFVDGKSLREVARFENVSVQSVSESITSCSQKIYNFFSQKHPDKTPFSRR
ncbi:MAG: hypothetical protein LUC94_09280 [Clostridiales bacterium]|nr:hypothetical protein [Clostridiales bacterium]